MSKTTIHDPIVEKARDLRHVDGQVSVLLREQYFQGEVVLFVPTVAALEALGKAIADAARELRRQAEERRAA